MEEGWDVSCGRRGQAAGGWRDLLDGLAACQPDVVFHMAGLSRAAEPAMLYEANTLLTARLIDAAAALPRRPRIVLAGSAAEYGPVATSDVPVTESHQCQPVTDYAVSKYAQSLMAAIRAGQGVALVVARIWNPIGPGMPKHMALANFAAQIAAFPPSGGLLRVGNLEVERDFIDVREVARLTAALGRHPDAGGQVINICSGRHWKLRGLVDAMIAISARSVSVVVEAGRLRAAETPVLYGDITRLIRLGLPPRLPDFNLILPEMLFEAGQALFRSPP